MHQKLRSLNFALKLLYHLVSEQREWSEAKPSVMAKVAEAKKSVINQIRQSCDGLLIDSPLPGGGNTNTGPAAIALIF